jgi:SAM-dependent methyltransferase
MDHRHGETIANDYKESRTLFSRAVIRAKLAWYGLTRPVMDRRWQRLLSLRLGTDPVFRRVDVFLNGEGGMFKKYVYALCDRIRPLAGAKVLVPGAGYGKNLLQLTAFRPAEVVAFDLFEYPKSWRAVAEKAQANFNVKTVFMKGDFDIVPRRHRRTFDFVISDAVLEHVTDMPKFIAAARDFLKSGGIFYASFGPLWYGPSGDHVDWGEDRVFDHLLLSKEEYQRQKQEQASAFANRDSCDAGVMFEQDLFSYLKAAEYLKEFDQGGFEVLDLRAKVSPTAFRLLRDNPRLQERLEAAGVPAFDRFSSGMYIWAKKK